MAINRPGANTSVQPKTLKTARPVENREACLWQRGKRRVDSIPPERTAAIIKQAPDKSLSRPPRRSLSTYRLKSRVPQQLQHKIINDFSLALQKGDLKQLTSITSRTYHLPTLQVMAGKFTDATNIMNMEKPLLDTASHQLHKAMANVLFFQLGGYTADGLVDGFLASARDNLRALSDDICHGTLEYLKTKKAIEKLGIDEHRPETKQFIEMLADQDFDQAEVLVNKYYGYKILEYMGKKVLLFSKYPPAQEAGIRGAEIIQNRLQDLKVESLFHKYGGNDPEGPNPDILADATANELSEYPMHFIRTVKQRLESRLNPEQIAEKLLARQVGAADADQLFSGNDKPDSSGNTILDTLDTEKILDICAIDLIDYTEAFRKEVLAILDIILMPGDAPDRLPPQPPLPPEPPEPKPSTNPSGNRNKG